MSATELAAGHPCSHAGRRVLHNNGLQRTRREAGHSVLEWLYRTAGWLVSALGGSLQSRIMSFVVPEGSADQAVVDRTIGALRTALGAQGVSLRVNQTQLSRDAALQSEDVRPLVPEGASSLTFYELCVPTHRYWSASTIVQRVLQELK